MALVGGIQGRVRALRAYLVLHRFQRANFGNRTMPLSCRVQNSFLGCHVSYSFHALKIFDATQTLREKGFFV